MDAQFCNNFPGKKILIDKRQITTNIIEVFQVSTTNAINVTHQVIIMLCEHQTLVYLSPVG